MQTTKETELSIEEEIASFYDDPKEALKLLRGKHTTPMTRNFLKREKALFDKRKENGVGSPVIILELTLDESLVPSATSRTLGLPAYQAEMYYRGK